MAQVAPPTKLALQSIQVNENLSKYPQTHYGIPKSDNDFASARDSLRDRERGITSNSFVTANQKVTLIIPPQQRNIVPDETIIRFKLKVNNMEDDTQFDGSIQRAIRTLVIRDGRGTVLEQIHDYNLISQKLIDVHIPERVQHNVMQTEGIYPTYANVSLDRPVKFCQINGVADIGAVGESTELTNTDTKSNDPRKNFSYTSDCAPGDAIIYIPDDSLQATAGQTVKGATVRTITTQQSTKKIALSHKIVADRFTTNGVFIHAPRPEVTAYYKHVKQPLLNGQEITLAFQLIGSGLLTSSKHIPLWVTKGLQIEMTLDSNQIIFQSRSGGAPEIQITQADVMYTAVTLTPVMQSALESQYHRRGLNLLVPVFHVDLRNVGKGVAIQEDYYNSFAMLNRIYQGCRNQDKINTFQNDSLENIRLAPTRRYIEYNRIYMPHWGNDNDLNAIDHYLESRKGINLLGDKKMELISLSQFNGKNSAGFENPADYLSSFNTSMERCKEIFVNNLETEPSGFLTGVDTNNGTIRLRIETPSGISKQIYMIFMAFKMITFQDGSPPLVQE